MTFLPDQFPGLLRLFVGAAALGFGTVALVLLVVIQTLLVPALFGILETISSGNKERERVRQNRARTRDVVRKVRHGAGDLAAMGNNEVRRALRGPRSHRRRRR